MYDFVRGDVGHFVYGLIFLAGVTGLLAWVLFAPIATG